MRCTDGGDWCCAIIKKHSQSHAHLPLNNTPILIDPVPYVIASILIWPCVSFIFFPTHIRRHTLIVLNRTYAGSKAFDFKIIPSIHHESICHTIHWLRQARPTMPKNRATLISRPALDSRSAASHFSNDAQPFPCRKERDDAWNPRRHSTLRISLPFSTLSMYSRTSHKFIITWSNFYSVARHSEMNHPGLNRVAPYRIRYRKQISLQRVAHLTNPGGEKANTPLTIFLEIFRKT